MKIHGMTAEVFLTAFKTMPKKEQNIFLSKIVKDSRLREDLIDIAIAESRAKDKGESFREFLRDSGE
jgi:mRNA interferase RelE/StbE